jgi:hypothetical protein
MKKILVLLLPAFLLAGCAGLQTAINDARSIYNFATTATVSSGQVGIVANAYDALKGTATNYARYCITNKFPQPLCSSSNRRDVVKAIRAGDAARNALEASVASGQPVTATLYNALVSAVNALKATPINTVQ